MVRINLIKPKYLSDQHLIAEYNEILMLFGQVKKYPKTDNIPGSYCLGTGHINFFKNKLKYLQDRHGLIKTEMKSRGFKAEKEICLGPFDLSLHQNWQPEKKDFLVIKKRIQEKILMKPEYYRYYHQKKSPGFFLKLLDFVN